jgi:hypothetical protein
VMPGAHTVSCIEPPKQPANSTHAGDQPVLQPKTQLHRQTPQVYRNAPTRSTLTHENQFNRSGIWRKFGATRQIK